jgi:hypothetical protein
MKPLSDEEIQAMVEALHRTGESPVDDDESTKLYKQLFDELATEPPVDLPLGFSKNVVRLIQQQQAARHQKKAYLVFGFVSLLMLGVAFTFQALQSANDSAETRQALSHIKWPVLFLVALVSLIQWADHRFVKSKRTS